MLDFNCQHELNLIPVVFHLGDPHVCECVSHCVCSLTQPHELRVAHQPKCVISITHHHRYRNSYHTRGWWLWLVKFADTDKHWKCHPISNLSQISGSKFS